MISLLDVNVLVALAWPNHEHHEPATLWFQENEKSGWATCPITQSGFIRVSSNERVIPGARSPVEAANLLVRVIGLPNHVFFADDRSLVAPSFVDFGKLTGYRQVTDAHLLGIALRHGGRLATFDRALRGLVPGGYVPEDAICLIE